MTKDQQDRAARIAGLHQTLEGLKVSRMYFKPDQAATMTLEELDEQIEQTQNALVSELAEDQAEALRRAASA